MQCVTWPPTTRTAFHACYYFPKGSLGTVTQANCRAARRMLGPDSGVRMELFSSSSVRPDRRCRTPAWTESRTFGRCSEGTTQKHGLGDRKSHCRPLRPHLDVVAAHGQIFKDSSCSTSWHDVLLPVWIYSRRMYDADVGCKSTMGKYLEDMDGGPRHRPESVLIEWFIPGP